MSLSVNMLWLCEAHLRRFSGRQKFRQVLSFSRTHWQRGTLLGALESASARRVRGALPSPYETTRLDATETQLES